MQLDLQARPESGFDTPRLNGPFGGFLLTGNCVNRTCRKSAIYNAQGHALPDSDIAGQELNTIPARDPHIPEDLPVRVGPVLFAGLVLEQFGHVLMNSLGRLWALENLPKDVTLLFVPKRKVAASAYPFLRSVLDMLGIENRILIEKGPMRFSQIYTASDLFGERYGGRGVPEFYDWLDRRLPEAGPVVAGSKVYLTRSRLGKKVGRFACEDHLEAQLAAQGYEIVAPERLSLLEQIALYRRTERLIFSEGSALHLYGLVRRPGQRAAVINRREALPDLIRAQMNDRAGTDVAEIRALRRVFWPPLRSDHLSVSLLHFKHLRNGLIDADMIDRRADWQAPCFEAEKRCLTAGLEPGEQLLNRAERQAWLRVRRRTRDGKPL